MKILYGVQGTGNGHISRANAMALALQKYPEIEVTWLLSGREESQGLGDIKDFIWREGMTFVIKDGQIKAFATFRKNKFLRFIQDYRELDLSAYDLLISDFEPVISHAARKQGIPIVGIGHQYAFEHKIPVSGSNPISKAIMKNYAPVTQAVGLHWHHFDQSILPPIIDLEIPDVMPELIANKVIVYLPFENPEQVISLLSNFTNKEFYIYHPQLSDNDNGHIHTRAISRGGFKQDLFSAKKVMCNSGFELISECLQLGKSILAKPLKGQMEQHSNALALQQLAYADVISSLDKEAISIWLTQDKTVKVVYPDVAASLAQWIAEGCQKSIEDLSSELWNLTLSSETYQSVA